MPTVADIACFRYIFVWHRFYINCDLRFSFKIHELIRSAALNRIEINIIISQNIISQSASGKITLKDVYFCMIT